MANPRRKASPRFTRCLFRAKKMAKEKGLTLDELAKQFRDRRRKPKPAA